MEDKGTEELFDRLAGRYDAWFDEEGKLPFQIELEAFRWGSASALPRPESYWRWPLG
ncbi:MAG TPA: hypothetical protein P5568_07930 [Acidobacteriota bacterium]|nr:hypothetical protein [Acidobacteriota bacterium]